MACLAARRVRMRAMIFFVSRTSRIFFTFPDDISNLSWPSFKRSSERSCRNSASDFPCNSFVFIVSLSNLPLNDGGFRPQLASSHLQSFPGLIFREPLNFKDDPPGTHWTHVVIHRTLASAHRRLGSLFGDGLVREYANPHLPSFSQRSDDHASPRFKLASRDPFRSLALQAVASVHQERAS